MKRRFLFSLFIPFLFMLSAQAQIFKGGLSLGLLASQIDGDRMEGYHKPGLYAATFVRIPLKDGNWGLQTELDYMQKGCKAHNDSESGILNTYQTTIHQVGVPVLAQWNCLKRYRLEWGVSFNANFLIRSRRDGEISPYTDDADYRLFECSGIGGVIVQFNPHWDCHLRYMYSLLPIGKSLYRRTGLRNNSILLNISYIF